MTPPQHETNVARKVLGRLRVFLLTGLLVLAPSAVTLWVFFRLLNWVDNLLGRYLRFAALDYHRIPGLGLLATLLLLTIVGWVASSTRAARWSACGTCCSPASPDRDRLRLDQVPGRGVLNWNRRSARWCWCRGPPRMWRMGFITGRASPDVSA
jgi:hypothetical protein